MPDVALLERDAMLDVLDGQLAAALEGDGRLVLVTGEAGVGKSALVQAFAARHESAVRVLRGACDALFTPGPLGPLADIARTVGGEVQALLSAASEPYTLFSAFHRALRERPTIVGIEDVHWADDATLDLLTFVGRRLTGTRALILVTYRHDEVGPEHRLRAALGRLASTRPHRLRLPPLTAGAVSALAAEHAVDPTELYRVTAGNPFYVTECLASGLAEVPPTVADSVLARGLGLSADARRAWDAAAVLPGGGPPRLVAAIGELAESAVDECLQVGLLVAADGVVRFRHELARRAVEQAIPAGRRSRLHARALHLLDGEADPATLADHAVATADPDLVVRYAIAAAEHSTAHGAHAAAAAQYAQALRHADRLAPADRADALERYGQACSIVDRPADAADCYERAAALWRELGDRDRTGRAMAMWGAYLWGAGQGARAHETIDAAVALLRPEDGAALAVAYAQRARMAMLSHDVAGAVEAGRRAIALAEADGDTGTLARAHNAVGSALWFVRPDEAEPTLERSLALAQRLGNAQLAASAMVNLGSGAAAIRRYDAADRWLDDAITWCGERDLDANLHYAQAWRARTALERGQWDRAGTLAGRLVAQPVMPATRIVALTVVGLLRVRRGDPGAREALDEAWDLARAVGELQRLWPVAAARAEYAWWQRTGADADGLAETLRLAVARQHRWAIGELALWSRRLGGPGEVPTDRPDLPEPYRRHLAGDLDGAAAAWDALGCPYEAALVRLEAGEAEVWRALAAFEALGARTPAAAAGRRLRALGVTGIPRGPRPTTANHPAGLTAREAEVLDLVRAGLSNAEIGQRLYISPRTVDRHVSAVLQKLGVSSRREAARMAIGTVPR
jgi:DNA-binding CsgD family transcriptional regulator/tetratricopeptide (TPR) repeat protein